MSALEPLTREGEACPPRPQLQKVGTSSRWLERVKGHFLAPFCHDIIRAVVGHVNTACGHGPGSQTRETTSLSRYSLTLCPGADYYPLRTSSPCEVTMRIKCVNALKAWGVLGGEFLQLKQPSTINRESPCSTGTQQGTGHPGWHR